MKEAFYFYPLDGLAGCEILFDRAVQWFGVSDRRLDSGCQISGKTARSLIHTPPSTVTS